MSKPKVFCIGFQKTGTTSLGRALEILGYRASGYWEFRDFAQEPSLTMDQVIERAHALVGEFDAFKDTPWPVLYRELDAAYPGSKFIHIVRDTQSWINSATRDFGSHPNHLRRLIYGCDYPVGNEQIWIDRYEAHNKEVAEYFKNRPEDFITLHLNRGEVDFEPICKLLGLPIPEVSWPHVNQIGNKKRRMLVARILKKIKGK